MRIDRKQIGFSLWQAGAFGNKLRTWNALEEILHDGFRGSVSMRYRGVWNQKAKYNVAVADILRVRDEWVRDGAQLELITFNESAPDERVVLQGEVMLDYGGYVMTYSRERGKMRDVLNNGARHARGLLVKLLLEGVMTPSSYADMMAVMELFPNHAVEFGVYAHCLGDIPGRNAVVWEVRSY